MVTKGGALYLMAAVRIKGAGGIYQIKATLLHTHGLVLATAPAGIAGCDSSTSHQESLAPWLPVEATSRTATFSSIIIPKYTHTHIYIYIYIYIYHFTHTFSAITRHLHDTDTTPTRSRRQLLLGCIRLKFGPAFSSGHISRSPLYITVIYHWGWTYQRWGVGSSLWSKPHAPSSPARRWPSASSQVCCPQPGPRRW